MNRSLTPEQEEELALDYKVGRVSANDLSVQYRISVRTVFRILARQDTRRQDRRHRKRPPKPKPRSDLKPCGTDAAYRRHLAHGERPCIPCVDAHNMKAKEYKTPKRKVNVCGTDAGYARHRRRRELACEACLKAHSRANSRRRKRKLNREKQ